jgi:hypothetical protein
VLSAVCCLLSAVYTITLAIITGEKPFPTAASSRRGGVCTDFYGKNNSR